MQNNRRLMFTANAEEELIQHIRDSRDQIRHMRRNKHIIQLICTASGLLGIFAQQEAPLKVTVDKLELVRCNKDYVENAKAVVFHYNDTHQAVNASWKLIKDLGMDLKDNVDIYGVESDGPHLMSTAKDINICDILGGGFPELEELFKFGNFTKCPMKAGYYGATNAILDTSKVPPNAPKGTFMLDIKTSEGDVEIANCKLTITIA